MINVKQAAKLLKLSEQRVRILLNEGRIVGAQRLGSIWIIPDKPEIDPPLKVEHRAKPRRTKAATRAR